MEKELNYLSEKIELIEGLIDNQKIVGTELITEKELLENILNKLTEIQLMQ